MNALLTQAFLRAVNHLLQDEPAARASLQPHVDKTVRLDLGQLVLQARVASDASFEPDADCDAPAVTLTIAPADLPRLLQEPARAMSYVKVAGDAEFANVLSRLSQTLRWEPEADLAPWVGDLLANRLVDGVKAGVRGAVRTQRALAENLAEYLTEENPTLVSQPMLEHFRADLVTLRDDVERLMKRIDMLEGRRG